MERALEEQGWNWYPYTKPYSNKIEMSNIKYLCVTSSGNYSELYWIPETGNWFNKEKNCVVSFNGMYTALNEDKEETTSKKYSIERITELIQQRNSLAHHLLRACGGFVEDMHYSPFVLSYDSLYTLCKRFKEKQVAELTDQH